MVTYNNRSINLFLVIGLVFLSSMISAVSTYIIVTNSLDSNNRKSDFHASSFSVGHSQPTRMSLQGKVTNSTGGIVTGGNLTVKISTTNSCTQNVFYDYNFANSIQDGIFNILLGQNDTLWTDFNKDYWMCLYVNNELLSGPTQFRGGQGEVNRIGDANSNSYVIFDYGNIIVRLQP